MVTRVGRSVCSHRFGRSPHPRLRFVRCVPEATAVPWVGVGGGREIQDMGGGEGYYLF
jgi:hypothetical protein